MLTSGFLTRETCPGCGESRPERFRRLIESPFVASPIREYLESFYGAGRIDTVYLEGSAYVLEECQACTLVFQKHVLGPDLMERLYEEWIDPHESFEQASARDISRRTTFMVEVLHIGQHFGRRARDVSVLDFGMGWGTWCEVAIAMGFRCAGVDLAKSRRDHADPRITVLTVDEIPSEAYDFINANQVFEHLANPLEVATRLAEALRPEGILRISVPYGTDIHRRLKIADWSAEKGTRNSLNAVSPLEHINCFTGRALTALGQRAGLRRFHLRLQHAYSFTNLGDSFGSALRSLRRPLNARYRGTTTDQMFRRSARS